MEQKRILSVRWILSALLLSALLSSISNGTSIANVSLPTLAQAYLLAITTLVVSVGRLGDITGRRRLLCFRLWCIPRVHLFPFERLPPLCYKSTRKSRWATA